jgi:superfamily II DNA or RNA helicase
MSQYFITNTPEKSLSKVIQGILPTKAEALDFLVGYFYFSGIEEIYKNIADKKMRILVGLEMEKDFQNKTSEFDFFVKKQKSSRQDIRNDNYESLVSLFNQSDYFEGQQQEEAFKIYYEKIKNGTLEIRKTKEPSHAKMYIFSYKNEFAEDGETPGCVITGSSNLTFNGLRGQNEINVRFNDKPEYVEACSIFETLWENAIILADKEHIKDFEDGVIKHVWYEKVFSPYHLYLRVLYEYFNIDTSKRIRTPFDITKGKFFNLKYQEDAVRMAISTIQKHNGVIISDVVGLGKSIIGSATANNLNLRTIIIAPPHLVPQWEDYSEEFRFTSRVFSRGVIAKALQHYRAKSKSNEQWLIVIDEAHSYRNEFTQDYAILHELCQGNKVMLLTATPFNNQPSDIYSMIKLFQIPTKSTLQTVDNLGQKFRDLISRYKTLKKEQKEKKISRDELVLAIDTISREIRTIISPLIIRRSRLDLNGIPAYKDDLKLQGFEFPEVEPPKLMDYDLGDLRDLYLSTLRRISKGQFEEEEIDNDDYQYTDDIEDVKLTAEEFKAARYKPVMYVKPEQEEKVKKAIEEAGFEYNLFKGTQRNLAKFMRSLLVRRFESSQAAFRISLNNMLQNCINIEAWAAKRNTVPVFKKGMLPDIEELYNTTSDVIPEMVDDELEAAIEKLNTRGLFEIKTEYLKPDFFEDLRADIELLQTLKDEWDKVTVDPKSDEFIEILKEKIKSEPTHKIVVFSQFADTVNSLGEKLENAGLPVFSYTAGKASPRNKEIIKVNFDAGVDVDFQQDNYKILVATDAISEGYNLHRAGAIFNYDIPYNPTRVIQRIGRINRVNKKMFDKLYIFNYFPTDIGESETRTQEISTLKMAMIHAIMGEDTKVLTSEEQLRAFFIEQYKKINETDEQKSWDTAYRALLNQFIGSAAMKEALSLPLRSKTRRRVDKGKDGVLVFARKGNDYVFKFNSPGNTPVDISPQDAFSILQSTPDEKGYEVSERFEAMYNETKKALFASSTESDTEKSKRDALDKIRLIIQSNSVDHEYLEDVKTAIEYDAISGYALRQINKLKTSAYTSLPDIVSKEYVQKALYTYDHLLLGTETLILAEEIESIENEN